MIKTSLLPRALLAAAVGLAAAAATASAQTADFTLSLTAPPAVVGQPLILDATGTIPLDELAYPYWFSLDAIPTSVAATCPADRWAGVQVAQGAGGSVVVLSQRETPDAAGRFSIPVAITPTAPGSVLLCGYTDDGLTNTLARAALVLDIERATPPPVALARAIRSCRALLSGAGRTRCVRAAARRARAGCRGYPSHRRQARCLRKVRRVMARH